MRSNPALLNEETAWNSPNQAAFAGSPNRARKADVSTSHPATSHAIANRITSRSTGRTDPRSRTPSDSWASIRLCSALPRPTTNSSRSVEKLMNPRPPSWMRASTTTCPNGLQYVPVSTTTRPVTHTAETAVNSAVTGPVQAPEALEMGSIRTTVPRAMRTRNPVTSATPGRGRPRTRDRRAVPSRSMRRVYGPLASGVNDSRAGRRHTLSNAAIEAAAHRGPPWTSERSSNARGGAIMTPSPGSSTRALARLDAAARLILRDPELARDAVQETLIRAWRDLPGLRDPDRFDAWLHRLTVNACSTSPGAGDGARSRSS